MGWRWRSLVGAFLVAVATLPARADLPTHHDSTGPVAPLWDTFPSFANTYPPRGIVERPRHAAISADGSRLYVLRNGPLPNGDPTGLVAAFLTDTGQQLWASSESAVQGGIVEIDVSDDDIVVGLYRFGQNIFVVAFDGPTGTVLWRWDQATVGSTSVLRLDVSSATRKVAAVWAEGTRDRAAVLDLDAGAGGAIWTADISPHWRSTRDVRFSPDGLQLFASIATPHGLNSDQGITVKALSAGNGNEQWSEHWISGYVDFDEFVPFGSSEPYALDVSPDGSTVVVAGLSRAICNPGSFSSLGESRTLAIAYGAAEGGLRWLYLPDALGGSSTGNPCTAGRDAALDLAITADGRAILTGHSLPVDPPSSQTFDVLTLALDLDDGTELWANRETQLGGVPNQSYVRLTPDGNTAVIASMRGVVPETPECTTLGTHPAAHAVSIADGTTIWTDIWTPACESNNGGQYQDAVLSPDGKTLFAVAQRSGSAQGITALRDQRPDTADTTPPVIDPVNDITAPATGPGGAIVVYDTPGATDDVDGPVAVVCAPASGSTFPIGATTVVCTASDAAGNEAQSSFVVTVTAVIEANLQVSLAPTSPHLLGATVAYIASVHNAGPGSAGASLTVELQYRSQAAWGNVPPTAAINGVIFMDLGNLAAGQTVNVPFEVIYQAFGRQAVTAFVAGTSGHTELNTADDTTALNQIVDLPLDHPDLDFGGFRLDGVFTTGEQGLAVIGVRIPGPRIAGNPPGDLFVPVNLTPGDLVAGGVFVPAPPTVNGRRFLPAVQLIAGDIVIPQADSWTAGSMFVAGAQDWLGGDVSFPALDASSKDLGRLLFARGAGAQRTDALVTGLGDTSLRLRGAASSTGLEVSADQGLLDADVELCSQSFRGRLGHGDAAAFTCGSLTTEVLTGEVIVELLDGTTLAIPAGATVHVTEQETGGFDVTVVAGGGVVVTVGEVDYTLNEGDTLDTADPVGPGGDPNQPPVAGAGGPYLGAVDTTIAFDGTASSDPDGDTLTYAWSAAEGTLSGAATATPGFSATEAGIYTVVLEVCDPEGLCHSAETSVVVYDPSAGFVTGGGWIQSPAGSCGPAAPADVCGGDTTGRANFGFVAKYQKGAKVPEGQTEFVFQAGNLRFHSDVYEWLVVSGKDRAQFKGVGSINGAAGYQFMITAFDGGPNGADGFRIKITAADGSLVYDNRAGLDDALTQGNTQVISGGNIVIHAK